MPSFRRRQILALSGLASVGLAGCLSPETPDAELDAVDGRWTMAGQNAGHTRAIGGDVTDPETVWTAELPDAQATGTPSLDGETLYVPANATDRYAQYRHQLYAISATTSELRWYTPFRAQRMNSPPAISDVIGSGGRVVMTTRPETERGRVVALDESGGEVWVHDVDARLTAPPTIDDFTVYVADWDGTLRAFRVDNGEERWSTTVGDGWAVAQPVACHDETLYLATATSSGRLVALDAEGGAEQWSQSTDIVVAGPVVADDFVAVRTRTGIEAFDAAGDHRFTFGIPEDRGDDIAMDDGMLYVPGEERLYAIDRAGERAWVYDGADRLGAPTVVGETVLVAEDGEIVALSKSDGEVSWRADTEGAGDIIATDGALFLAASEGQVTALES